jgi:type IV secretory pathway TraG/TraD family ATPase VirD4
MFPSIGGISLENLAKFTVQETIVKCLSKAGADSETIDGEVVKDDEGVVARRKKKIIYKNTPAGDLYRKFNKLTEQNQSQLTILHNDFEELYTNTKDVISSSGLSVKDLMRVNPSGQILLFQFAPNITNKMIEKILLYDIEQLANYNEMQRNIDKKKMVLIIDEAPSILQDQDHVSEMSQQFRSKNITLAFGIQEKAGVEKDNKHGLLNTIINNCSTFFISRLRDKETIEAISAIHGTRKHLMPTDQTVVDADGNISHSGAGSLRVDEEFIWHPNDIRKLLKGQVMFSTLAQQLVNN